MLGHWLLPVFRLNISSDLVPVGLDLTLLYNLSYTKPTRIPVHFEHGCVVNFFSKGMFSNVDEIMHMHCNTMCEHNTASFQ